MLDFSHGLIGGVTARPGRVISWLRRVRFALLVGLTAGLIAHLSAHPASALPADAMAPTRLQGEVGVRATLVRELLATGHISAPGALAEDPPVQLVLPIQASLHVPTDGVDPLLPMWVAHGLVASQAEALALKGRLALVGRRATEPGSGRDRSAQQLAADRLGRWLDALVWMQDALVDGAALGARSQALPNHLKRPTKKQRAARARDLLRRRFRAVRQVAALVENPTDIAAIVRSWLVEAGPGGWSAYVGLVAELARYRALALRPQPAMPADTPTCAKLAWRQRRLRRRWERQVRPEHRQALRARLCFEGYCPRPTPPARSMAPPSRPGATHPSATRHASRVHARARTPLRGLQSDEMEQLRAWQRHRGLRDHGMIDAPTLAALAVPMATHVDTIRLSLQRMRDTGAGGTDHFFIANIPAFQLDVWRAGKRVRRHRTQVGKGYRRRGGKWVPGRRTPLISARLRYLVLNPEWVVPSSIRREYRWKIKKDPDYLIKHGFELRGSSTASTLVMKAGPGNLLGRVKFLFTNAYLVYLHDTPSQWAFQRPRRTTSHGCVRVQHAEELARYLLAADRNRTYSTRSWGQLMARVRNKWKPLRHVISIHLVYWTAQLGVTAKVRLLPDIYHYDGPDRQRWRAADLARSRGLL